MYRFRDDYRTRYETLYKNVLFTLAAKPTGGSIGTLIAALLGLHVLYAVSDSWWYLHLLWFSQRSPK